MFTHIECERRTTIPGDNGDSNDDDVKEDAYNAMCIMCTFVCPFSFRNATRRRREDRLARPNNRIYIFIRHRKSNFETSRAKQPTHRLTKPTTLRCETDRQSACRCCVWCSSIEKHAANV